MRNDAADLDQLAARDRHLAPERQRVQDQQHRRGIVVHHGGGLGAGDLAQQARDVFIAFAAPPGGEVEFQRGGGRQGFGGGGGGARRQRRAAEIGVQHCAGQVEYRPLRGGKPPRQGIGGSVQDGGRRCRECARRAAGGQFGAQARPTVAVRPKRAISASAVRRCAAERRATAAGWRNPAWRRHATAHEHDIRDTDAAHRATGAAGASTPADHRCVGRHGGQPGGAPLPRQQSAEPRGGMGGDGDDPRSMGAARLRRRSRVERRTEAAAPAYAGVLHPAEWPEPELAYSLDQRILGARHRHRSGARGARLGVHAGTASRDWPASSCRRTRGRFAWRRSLARCAKAWLQIRGLQVSIGGCIGAR